MSFKEDEPLFAVVLGFNVLCSEDVKKYADENHIKILNFPVIYHLIEEYEDWVELEKKKIEAKQLESITKPCKIKIMKGYVFRQSNPAICGVEVLNGVCKKGIFLMKNGKQITQIKAMQKEKKNIQEAEKGEQVALSLTNITIGRQVNEEDILYSYINEDEFRTLKKFKEFLSKDDKEVLKEIAEIMRENTKPTWGI